MNKMDLDQQKIAKQQLKKYELSQAEQA